MMQLNKKRIPPRKPYRKSLESLIKWITTDFAEIPGIHFNNNIEMTKRYNIRKCIQKKENKIKIQNRRHISVKEKTMIINIILISKLWHVCSVFSLPRDLLPEIKKNNIQFSME